jgi:hypothetical protein
VRCFGIPEARSSKAESQLSVSRRHMVGDPTFQRRERRRVEGLPKSQGVGADLSHPLVRTSVARSRTSEKKYSGRVVEWRCKDSRRLES